MAKFDDIKDVLFNYDIEIISDIESDLLCGICRMIVKEPYTAMCGCTHCKNCIDNFIKAGDRVCPGVRKECQNSLLDRVTDVHFDPKASIKLGKLLAKCPNKLCGVETMLSEMKQHIQMCQNRSTFCPFFSIGCEDNNITQGTMENHLRDNSCNHCNMMVEHINNTRNYMDSTIKEYEVRLERYKKEIDGFSSEINENTETIRLQQHVIHELRENTMVKNVSGWNGPLLNIIFVAILISALTISYGIYIQRNNEEMLEYYRRQFDTLSVRINNHEFGEYVWKIEHFNRKMIEAKTKEKIMIESDHFYSHRNGYRLKLQIYPNGFDFHWNVHLSVRLVMTMGPNDDILKWPFAQGVKIAFVNQITGEDVKSVFDYNNGYAYPSLKRATSGQNNSAADLRFDLALFGNMEGLVKNDAVFISCWVKPYV